MVAGYQVGEKGLSQRIEAVRHFNRFYTQKIGVLGEGLLHSSFSLAQVRVLYELAHRNQPTAAELAKDLGLDAGYLSRMLSDFEKRGLIEKQASEADGRQSLLLLTRHGQQAFAPLNARAQEEIGVMLKNLSAAEQGQLIHAMHTIGALLGARPELQRAPLVETKIPYILRPHQPGDMGWVVHRHGVLYAQEYGWDERFEALVAGIVAEFVQHYDPKRERCWIAEKEGEIAGSVFLVQQSKTVAKLRLLLVEPSARGLGIGARLVSECVRFARQARYRKITLWTQSILHAARHIYQKAGFRLARKERHNNFGYDLIGETWELEL
ncbi:MAG TPA: bifunctional helix-turn-helix transcriptional regulator/GNAT family N-acetyltransferase [Candidatus Angelobacter sp.]|nr:bifunctional helix-turn-helix transcriptional regulator/GNAT family N-acetyltransferase [Candidatus Angelobacter sp.]